MGFYSAAVQRRVEDPDLNPDDYKIWSILHEQVYKDIGELRQQIAEE